MSTRSQMRFVQRIEYETEDGKAESTRRVAQPTDEATDADGSGSNGTTATESPGFGLGIGVLAVLAGSLLGLKRHQP